MSDSIYFTKALRLLTKEVALLPPLRPKYDI